MNSKSSYHHGDLRRCLVDAAVGILRDTQRWDFSLREIARQAGVSHNAPYSHFADKQALLAAVAVAGYETLRERMLAASAHAADAGAALEAIGLAYVAFGTENPAHYRLMFGLELQADGTLPPALLDAGEAARSVLRDVLRQGGAERVFALDPQNTAELAIAVLTTWSVVHGFTSLAIDGYAKLERLDDLPIMAKLIAAQVNRGLMPR
jgi:AcrR family transcriptional regulator